MRIIYIHQYFLTPSEGGAVRSYHLAKGLVDAGIKVDMITSHNNPTYNIKRIERITIHYLPVKYDNELAFYRRIYAFLRFVKLARKLLKKLPQPDCLYITSTPLTTGMIGLWAKRTLALPYFFEVRDLWPEAPIQMGFVKNNLLKKLLYDFEKKIYREAMHLVALSPGIRDAMARVCPGKAISLIPNFADTDFFVPSEKPAENERNCQLTISYTGAVGPVNGLESLLRLAEEAKMRGKDWRFIIMGKGAARDKLQAIQQAKRLENVQFLPFGDKRAVRDVLSQSDFAYLSFSQAPVLETGSPNKFFDTLAMGKPIIMNYKGWIYDMVKEHQIGLLQDGGDYEGLISSIEKIYHDPVLKIKIAREGRALAEKRFSKQRAIQTLIKCLLPTQGKGGDASGNSTLGMMP